MEVRAVLVRRIMGQRHTCFVDLVHLVGRVGTVQRFVEGEDHLL